MKRSVVFFVVAFVFASATARATSLEFPAISTVGVWLPVLDPGDDGLMPFSNPSFDGPCANLGYLLANNGAAICGGSLDGFEYLYTPFRVMSELQSTPWQVAAHHTEDAAGVVSLGIDGTFTLAAGDGESYNSGGLGWDHFVLLRRWVEEVPLVGRIAQFFLGVEDMPFTIADREFQDHVWMALVFVPFPPVVVPTCVLDCGRDGGGEPVPEPAALVLFGLASLGFARYVRKR